jgi:hypothetical protein
LLSKIEFEAPSWTQIYDLLLNMAEKIKKNCFKFDIIVGVSRGGWIPARILSDLLDNSNLANVKVEFYFGIGETKKEPIITQSVSVDLADKKVLIVDEIADTGKSLKLVKEHVIKKGAVEVKVATIYYKPQCFCIPDYYVKKTSRWIIFPWEIKETVKKIIKTSSKKGESLESETVKFFDRLGVSPELVRNFLKEISGTSD